MILSKNSKVAMTSAGGISTAQMQAVATPQKVPVITDPHPPATLEDTLLIDDDDMDTPQPVHTSKSPEQPAEHSQGFDKTQQTPKTRAYLACMQRKSTDDLSLPKTPEHPTAEAAPVVVTPVAASPVEAAARPAHSTPAVVTPVAPVSEPAHVLTPTQVTASAEARLGSTAMAPSTPAATPTVVAPAHVLTPAPSTASAEAPLGSTALATAPAAPATTPTPVVTPAHVLTPTPVTASAEAPPGSTAMAPSTPAATPTVVAPAHVLTPAPSTASAEAPLGSTALATAPAAPAATPTPVVAPAHVLTPAPVATSAPSAPETPLEPEPQSPDPRLLQFWSRFKRSPMSREPLVRPLPPPVLNLPAQTEALYTVLDPLNWRHLIRSNVETRSDWRSCFVVAAYNHNTIFRFANERGEIHGTPQVSDFPLVVCKGPFPTEPIAAPELLPSAAATTVTTVEMPAPAPLAMTPPPIVDGAALPAQAAPALAVATTEAASASAPPSVTAAEVGSTSPMPPSPAVVGTPASHPAPPVTPGPESATAPPQAPPLTPAVEQPTAPQPPQPLVPTPPSTRLAENSADDRAQWMKFHRSIRHPKAPKEVTQKFHEASGDKAKMRALYQEFQRCNGDWLSSTLVIRDSQTTTNTQGGKDAYLSKADP